MEKIKDNGFSEKEIEELSLSKLFEKERKNKKLSLKLLSKKTRISYINLKNIEEGSFDRLPADIYVKNFLIKCADEFGVDCNVFLNLYNKEAKGRLNKQKERVEKIDNSKFTITPKFITKSSIFLFVIVVLFYFVFQLGSLLGDPEFFVLSPENDIITKQKELNIFGSTKPDNRVYINNNETFVDGDGYFSEAIPLQPGVNLVEIKVSNRLNREHVELRRVLLEENSL